VATFVHCDTCKGSGAEPGSRPASCRTCQGHGRVRAQQGFFTIERTCPTCQGSGQTIEQPCKGCGGQGRVRREKTLSANIPAGVEDGTRIRLAGEGEVGVHGAAPGDLYIFVSIGAHQIFQRDGANIFCRVPIPFTTVALGGTIEVPTVEGSRTRVTVPPGTQSGHQFRLRGKGMTVLRSAARGDMYIQAIVETPVNLTKRQQELLHEFEKASDNGKTNPESEGFFARVKEFFEDLRE
jgi:molecular chaperone DnaJ